MWLWLCAWVFAGGLGLGSKDKPPEQPPQPVTQPAVPETKPALPETKPAVPETKPAPPPVATSATLWGMPVETAQALWSAELQRLPADAFSDWLADKNPSVRARAAMAIGRLRDGLDGEQSKSLPPTTSMKLLAKALEDPEAEVRAAAAFGMGLTPGTGAMLLSAFATEKDASVRENLYWSLGKQGTSEALKLLLPALTGAEADWAALALGRMGTRKIEAVQVDSVTSGLLSLLSFPIGPTRKDAAWALARMGTTHASGEVRTALFSAAEGDMDPTVRGRLVRAWAAVAPQEERTQGLRRLLLDPSQIVRIAVVRAVGKFGCDGASGMLDGAVQDSEADVRVEAIAASATCLGDVEKLKGMLEKAPPDEQAALIRTLGKREALANPQSWLSSQHPLQVRVAAVEVLSDRKTWMEMALRSEVGPLRTAAAGALLDDAPTNEELLALLEASDEAVVEGAAAGLLDALKVNAQKASATIVKSDKSAKSKAKASKAPPEPTFESRVEKALLDALRRVPLSSSTVHACFQALSTLYLSGKVATVDPSAAAILEGWLKTFPALGKDMEPVAGLLKLTVPPVPAMELPQLADVMRIRSARILTEAGEMRVELRPDIAPLTVWNFARLAEKGYFDGLTWHRVVADFVVQTGDPRGDGWGGPGYTIPDELTETPYEAGTLGMALSGPDTGGSQWFVTLSDQPHLDGDYTVFGKLTLGRSVAGSVHAGDHLKRVMIERVSPVARYSVE